jgi:hypothetical protein
LANACGQGALGVTGSRNLQIRGEYFAANYAGELCRRILARTTGSNWEPQLLGLTLELVAYGVAWIPLAKALRTLALPWGRSFRLLRAYVFPYVPLKVMPAECGGWRDRTSSRIDSKPTSQLFRFNSHIREEKSPAG